MRGRERYLRLDEIDRVTIGVMAYTFNFLYYRQIIMSCNLLLKQTYLNLFLRNRLSFTAVKIK